MHPNLVAGAWIGFNDARVTLRSNYWGQGGHNALRVVGDFFHDALKAKLIDARAKFARPKRMPLVVHAGRPPEDWSSNFHGDDTESLPPDAGVIVSGNSASGSGRRPRTEDALASMLIEMGRDPMTGERVLSSGSNGNEIIEPQALRELRRHRGVPQSGFGLGANDLAMPSR
jgi:penicillin-binding protein 1A